MSKSNLVVILENPIKQGDNEIIEIELRKPKTGDLKKIKLLDLLSMDVDQLAELLPRITVPTLTKYDVYNLELVDTMAIFEKISSFFTKQEV